MTGNRSIEDYIKAIYQLGEMGGRVSTSALASALRLANPSVTAMLKKLSAKGLVSYVPYRGVGLTPSGRRMALSILRRHRLWEMFLVEVLGYSWDRVHDEAERLEHVTSEELEQKLDETLQRPQLDPHGDPIPTKGGTIAAHADSPLASCTAGEAVRVRRVSDRDKRVLEHAARMGITLNATLTVKQKMSFDGSMVVKIGSKEAFLSEKVANAIFVRPR